MLLRIYVVRPPRIELGLRVPETLVISFSLRAPARFYHPTIVESTRSTTCKRPGDAYHLRMNGAVGGEGFVSPN